MANSLRRRGASPNEQEIQGYMQQAGASGQLDAVDPQSVKRANSNYPKTRAKGFAQVAGQVDANQQQAKQQAALGVEQRRVEADAKRQQADADRMAKQQATEQEAQRMVGVRAAAAAGVKTTTDIQTGKRDIERHPDGAPVFDAGPQGGIFQDATRKTVMPAGFVGEGTQGRITEPVVTAPFKQAVRDDRGDVSTVDPQSTTDPKTGDKVHTATSPVTGQPVKTVVGVDTTVRDKAARLAQHEAESQDHALRTNNYAQAHLQFDPQWQPVKAEYLTAKEQWEKVAENSGVTRDPQGRRAKADDNGNLIPLTPQQSAMHQQTVDQARARLAAATAKYNRLSPAATQFTLKRRQLDEEKLKLAEKRMRIEMDLPEDDGGTAATLAKAAGMIEETPADVAAGQVVAGAQVSDSSNQASDSKGKYPVAEPSPEDLKWFKANPQTSGMAIGEGLNGIDGPRRIILNPYSKNKDGSPFKQEQYDGVAMNEALRHHMDESKPRLDFEPTPEQVAFFKGTEYGKPENRDRLKETIVARIITGDESAGKFTPEQEAAAGMVWKDFNGAGMSPKPTSGTSAPVTPETKPLIPAGTPETVKPFVDAFQGLANPEQFSLGQTGKGWTMVKRGEETIGSIERSKSGTATVVLNGNLPKNTDLREMVAFGKTGGAHVYLRDSIQRQDPEKEAGWVASVFGALQDPIAGLQANAASIGYDTGQPLQSSADYSPEAIQDRIRELGATPGDIFRKVNAGELSVTNGEVVMRDLYGGTLKADDPMDGATFGKWLAEADPDTKALWSADKTEAERNQVRSAYVNDWFIANRQKPGVTLAMRNKAEAALLKKPGTGEKAAALGGEVAQGLGSTVGMLLGMPGMFAGLGVAAAVNGKDSEEYQALQMASDNFFRGGKNSLRGFEANRERWMTAEGKPKYQELLAAQGDLMVKVMSQDSYPDGVSNPTFRKDYAAAVDRVTDAAYALHQMNPEEGWAVTRDDLDPSKNQALAKLVNGYALTGDESLARQYFASLLEDNGSRQSQAFIADATAGRGKFMSGVISGAYAPPDEIAIEVLSTVLTVGIGKAVFGGAKLAGATAKGAAGTATRMANFRAATNGLKSAFINAGMVKDTLQAPAGALGKAWNLGAKLGKVGVASAPVEAGEEAIAALHDRNATRASIAHDTAIGGLLGFMLGPIIGGPAAAVQAGQQAEQANQAAGRFAAEWNKSGRGTEGFVPLTMEQAKAAMALVPPQLREELKTKARAATRDMTLALTAYNHDQSHANAAALSTAQANSLAAVSAMADEASRRVEAVSAIQTLPPETRDFASGLAKVASGRPDLLTGGERRAVAGKTTRDGNPYFAQVQRTDDAGNSAMVDVVTDAGRAEALRDFPSVAELIQTPESVAIYNEALAAEILQATQTAQTNGQNTQGPAAQGVEANPQPAPANPAALGGAGPGAGGSPAPAQGSVMMDAAQYEAVRQSSHDMPDIKAAVTQAHAAGLPVSVSMAKAAGHSMPGYERNGTVLQPTAKTSAGLVAARVKAKVEAQYPRLAGRVTIGQKAGVNPSGGVQAYTGGTIEIVVPDLAREIALNGVQSVETTLEQVIIRHEVVHTVQFESVRSIQSEQGDGRDFETFYQEWYGKMAGELAAVFPVARDIYGPAAWDRIPTDGQKAAELVRMLVEAKLDPAQTGQFSELFRAVRIASSPTLLETLRKAIEVLTALVTSGKLPQSAMEHVNAVADLYNELVGTQKQSPAAKPAAKNATPTKQANAKETTDANAEGQGQGRQKVLTEPAAGAPAPAAPSPSGFRIETENDGKARLLLGDAVMDVGTPEAMAAELARLETLENTPLRAIGKALDAALVKFPRLAGKYRLELREAADEMAEAMKDMPPEDRAASAEKAIADRINRIADAAAAKTPGKTRMEIIEGFRAVAGKRSAQQAASIEQAVIGTEAPQLPPGRTEERDTPGSEMRISVTQAALDLSQLVGSSDPLFPGGALQPRNRSTQASKNQREEMVANLRDKPDQYRRYVEGVTTDAGRMVVAPLFAADGSHMTNEAGLPLFYVVSGNGRRNALEEAQARKVDGRYLSGVKESLAADGIDTAGMTLPVPVSVFVPKSAKEVIDLAEYSNRDAQLSVSNTEQANRDARSIEEGNLLKLWQPDASGDPAAASNRDFVKAFARAVGDEGILSGGAALTDEGAKRIERAMVAALLGPDQAPVLELLFNRAGPLGLRAVLGGVASETGALLKLAAAKPDFDLSPVLVNALRTAVEAKQAVVNGEIADVSEFFDQGNLFESTENTPERQLARAIVESRSRKAVREILTAYRTAAEAVDTSTASMFAEAETTREDLILKALEVRPIEQVIAEVEAEFGKGADLPAKLRVIAGGVKRLDAGLRRAFGVAIGAEAARLRDGVLSAAEWQRLNPDALSAKESLFQRFLDSWDAAGIRQGFEKLLSPGVQSALGSSPSEIDPETKIEVVDSKTGEVVWQGAYNQRKTARRVVDMRDNKYGGYRFRVRFPDGLGQSTLGSSPSIDPRISEAFGEFTPDEYGLPPIPKVLPDGHPLLVETNTKKTAVLPAEHPMVVSGRLPAGVEIPRDEFAAAVVEHFIAKGTPLPAGTQPVAFATGGGGGSGKSSTLEELEERGDINTSGTVLVNADEIKDLIPEYFEIIATGDGRAAGFAHEESSKISKMLLGRLLDPKAKEQYSFVFDATLANGKKNLAMFNHWKQRGYRLHLIGVMIDTREAMVRATLRAKKRGRWVANDMLAEAHAGWQESMTDYFDMADALSIYDNNGKNAAEVLKKSLGDDTISIANIGIWYKFKSDENEVRNSNRPAASATLDTTGVQGSSSGTGRGGRAAIRQPESQGQGGQGAGQSGGNRTAGQTSLAASPSPEDARYLVLAKEPDKNREELQRMVNAAALRRGYSSTVPVYHGTDSERQRGEYQMGKTDSYRYDGTLPGDWTDPKLTRGGLFYVTDNKAAAKEFAYGAARYNKTKERIIGLFLKDGNYFDASNPEHAARFKAAISPAEISESRDWWEIWHAKNPRGGVLDIATAPPQWYRIADGSNGWQVMENPRIVERLKSLGYDGFKASEVTPSDEYEFVSTAVFNPSAVKSSDPVTYRTDGTPYSISERFDSRSQSILRSSPSPAAQFDLFGGIEAQITGPRAAVKARAVATAKAQPEAGKARSNIAKTIGQREGLADLDLFAAGAVKALAAKPKRGESAPDENDLFSGLGGTGNRKPGTGGVGGTGNQRDLRGMAGEPDLFNLGAGQLRPGLAGGERGGGIGGGRGVRGDATAGDTERGATGESAAAGKRGDRRGRADGTAGDNAVVNLGPAGVHELVPVPENEADRNARIDPESTLVPKGQGAKIAANFKVLELLRKLTAEGRNPTTEEKAQLLTYSGWGHSKGGFDDAKAEAFTRVSGGGPEAESYYNQQWRRSKEDFKRANNTRHKDAQGNEKPSIYELYAWNEKWGDVHRELKEKLTEAEYAAANRSVLNAHYTTPAIIDAQWRMVEKLGFKGGRVLEPGAGIGHYIGTQPEHLAARTVWSAVELDKVTSQILALLYPQARVNSVSSGMGREVTGQGFEEAAIADNSQDLVISNVPFHEEGPWQSKKQFKRDFNLHNYFFARALQKVKPGGFVVFITSSSTMENNGDQRRFLASRSELISAVRLPNTAFKDNAGTEVTTDIIILRKPDGRKVDSHSWQQSRVVGNDTVLLKRGDQTPNQWLKSFDLEATWQNPALEAARSTWNESRIAGLQIPGGAENKAAQKAVDTATAAAWKAYVAKFEEIEGDTIGMKLGAVLPIRVNEYFAANPQNAFGRHALAGSMYKAAEYTLAEDAAGGTLEERFGRVIEALPADIMGAASTVKLGTVKDIERTDKPFSYVERDGKFWQVQKDHLEPMEWSSGEITAFRSWLRVKNAVRDLIDAELDPLAEADTIAGLRETLNREYGKHVGQVGPISATGRGAKHDHLADDPEFPLTLALENPVKYTDRKGKSATRYDKADIFRVRMNKPLAPPDKADTVADALTSSLVWMGYPNPGYMALLLGRPEAVVRQEAIESELVFDDPASGRLVIRDSYLSGFVQGKLDEAREAAKENPAYRRNVAALEAALPERKGIAQIGVAMNSPWMPPSVMSAFMTSLGLQGGSATYAQASNHWSVFATGNSDEYSTVKVKTVELIQHILEMTVPRVTKEEGTGKDKREVPDPGGTQLAKSMIESLKQEFQRWAKTSDAEVDGRNVQDLLVDAFNEKANGHKPPTHEGAHITLPGASDEVFRSAIRRSAIARMLEQGSGMIAHGVGFGKTYTLIALAMEMKRLGKANRPMIIVENATLSQFAASFRVAYPNANILVANEKSFAGAKRRGFVARIVTGDYDCIVMPHSSFNLIPNHQDVVNSYINSQIAELTAARALTDSSDRRAVAALENAKIKLENSRKKILDALVTRQDMGLFWEDLGIDALLVDESHRYKNAPVITRMQGMKNIPKGEPSQRAVGMVLKTQGIQDKMGGKGVFFATGTPVSNSMAEAYVMIRYTDPQLLTEQGVDNFDQFVAMFGTTETKAEANWKGAVSMETRLSKFINGNSLINLIRSSWDVQMDPDIAGINRPDVKGGESEQVMIQPGVSNSLYNSWVINTIAAQWESKEFWDSLGGKKQAFEDNPWMSAVPIMTMQAGIAAALDVRLIDHNAPDYPGSKVNTAVKEIAKNYHATQSYLGTQAVFADLRESFSIDHLLAFAGDPGLSEQGLEVPVGALEEIDADGNIIPAPKAPKKKKAFDLYQDMAAKLVAAGIPRGEIGLLTSAMSPEKRTELFDRVNSGEIRVVIGSTDLMGVGVNMQERLYALHHLMPPRDFKPASTEQRNGRILRQGNLHYDMQVAAFVTAAETATGKTFRKDKGGRLVPDLKSARAAMEPDSAEMKAADEAAAQYHISIREYAMEKSIDSAMYSMMASKQRMVVQLLMGEVTDFFEDPSDAISMGMAEIAARAIGDPALIRRVELEREIRNLTMEFQGFQADLSTARSALRFTENTLAEGKANLDLLQHFSDVVGKIGTDPDRETVWEFSGRVIDRNKPKDAEKGWKAPKLIESLDDHLQQESEKLNNSDRKFSKIPLTVDGVKFTIEVHQSLGDTRTEKEKYDDAMAGKSDKPAVKGAVYWDESVTKNSSGMGYDSYSGAQSLIQSISTIARRARNAPKEFEASLESHKKNLPGLQYKAARTFEKSAELAALHAEMNEVEARLAAAAAPPPAPEVTPVDEIPKTEVAPNPPEINQRIFSDEYTGPRWTYGLRNRPMMIGAQPKGHIIGSDGPAEGRARHGTVQYPRELTDKELYDFEMEMVNAPDAAPEISVGDWVRFKDQPGEGPWSVWSRNGGTVKLDRNPRNLSYDVGNLEVVDNPNTKVRGASPANYPGRGLAPRETSLGSSPSSASVRSYLDSTGMPREAVAQEHERVSRALEQIGAGRVADRGADYSQGDLFGGDGPVETSGKLGRQVATLAAGAVTRAKARTGNTAVSPDLIAGMSGDWEALAREVNAKGRASSILPDLINREIPSWSLVGTKIEGPEDVHALMLPLRSPYFESLKVMVLDGNNNIVHSQIITVGSVAEAVAHPADIFGVLARLRETTGKKHTNLIISHNHPSGEPSPSVADERITRALQQVADLTGWNVQDHVITNGETYYSFREAGMVGGATNAEKAYAPRLDGAARPKRITPEQRKAGWEAVPRGALKRMDNPDAVSQAAYQLRQGNPDSVHIFYLNTRLNLTAVERITIGTLSDRRKLAQTLLAGRGREGAYSFIVDLPESLSLEAVRRLASMAKVTGDLMSFRMSDASSIRSGPVGPSFWSQSDDSSSFREEPPSAPDLFTAASAPGATQALGQVKAGSMNALGAYRTLTAKRAKLGKLSPAEEDQLLRAEQALGQKLAFDMEELRGTARPKNVVGYSQRSPMAGRGAVQGEMFLAGSSALMDKSGQMSLLSSPSPERSANGGRTDGVPANQPGGANIGDGSLPGNSVITPEMDAKYMAAAEENNERLAGDLLQQAAILVSPSVTVAWHAGKKPEHSQFYPKSHFGPKESAEKRLRTIGAIKPIFQNGNWVDVTSEGFAIERFFLFGKFLRVRDYGDWIVADRYPRPFKYLDERLLNDKKLTKKQFAAWVEQYNAARSKTADDAPYELWAPNVEKAFAEFMKSLGYAGFVYDNEFEYFGDSYLVFDPSNIKSAKPIQRDASGNIIPLSRHFDQSPRAASGALMSSPSPESAAVQAALDGMPKLYREVFAAVSGGATSPEVMARFKITANAVTNILDSVRSRIATATDAAGPNGLQPAMLNGLIDGGRPDLALGANRAVAAVDQTRNDSDIPGVRGWDEVTGIAEANLRKDYAGEYSRLLAKAGRSEQMTDVEVATAKRIIAKETLGGRIKEPADRVKLAMLIHGYRDVGTETARALAIRRDPLMSPAERHAQFIAEALFSPDPETRGRLKKAAKGDHAAILAGWMKRVDAIKAELLAQGIDLDAAIAEYQAAKDAREQAEADSPRTKQVIDETIRKLKTHEKAVVNAIREGALVTKAAWLAGVSADEAKEIWGSFEKAFHANLRASAARFMAGSLAASPTGNIFADIAAEFGIWPLSMIDDTVPGFVDRRNEKPAKPRKPRAPKQATPAEEQPAPEVPGLTPEQQAALDEAWERFKAAPLSDWLTLFETEAKNLAPMIGQTGFAEWAGKAQEAWQARQRDLQLEPVSDTTGDWAEDRPFSGQGELIRPPVSDTQGTFDIHDPVAVKRVMDAFAIARGGKMDALMEFWRMSILSGPQTHIVNTGSNVLNAAYNLLPRRAAEAGVNSALSIVGLGSKEQATFGEFSAMSKNLRAAAALAGRNMLRSWQLGGSRVFETYATAAAGQMDFSGVGSEYIPPALGGKLGTVMRSISFRAMTAADEFIKSFYGQLEAAAQAHRIAKADEKLAGPAYAARVTELMEPGSKAWLRAFDEAKRITFQTDLDGTDPRAIRRLDQVAELAKKGRSMPWIGRPLTFFLPFIDTPLNIFKMAVEMSPLGGAIAVIDGARALKRRIVRGDLTKAEAAAEAEALYNRARFVTDLTNQTIGFAAYFALQALVTPPEDDDDSLPVITGTVPYKTTARGERNNSYAVMPPMTIRLGDVQFSYSRVEPFATVMAGMVDLLVSINRHGGMQPGVASEWLMSFKDQAKDKTFLQGLSNLINVFEDPKRWAEKLTTGIVTGFVPNLIRQPIREMNGRLSDTSPQAGDGFLSSVAKSVGYGVVPQAAPPKLDVWGNEIAANRGELVGGTRATDLAFRILDPTNAVIAPKVDPIDRWIFRYNLATADSKQRIAIQPIDDSIDIRKPGEKSAAKVPLTRAEHLEANRRAGQAARAMLGDWGMPDLTPENAERITDAFQQVQRVERARIRAEKLAEMP